ISRGETVGIVGESGCGKSTLARVMVGLQPTTSGEVYFNGEKLRHGGAARRVLGRSVSVIFQDPATALMPRLTIHDALIDPLNVHRIDSPRAREKRVRDLLHLVACPSRPCGCIPPRSPVGSASAWPSPVLLPWDRTSWWRTNPPAPWTSRCVPRC